MCSVVGTSVSGRRGLGSDTSVVSAFQVKDLMDMDLHELIHKYNRTLRVLGLLRYLLEPTTG